MAQKFKFFTVSSLTDYVIENEKKLLHASILQADTFNKVQGIDIRTGIKSSEQINIIATTGEFQADSSCAYNSSGATTFTQRQLTVASVAVMQTFCPKELEAKYTQKLLTAGDNKDFGSWFTEFVTNNIVLQIASNLNKAIWQGDSSQTYDANLKLITGWLKILDDATGVVDATASTMSIANSRTIFENIYSNVPSAVLGNGKPLISLCGWDTFRMLQTKLTQDNLYHYTGESANGTLAYPGSNIKVVAISGLNSDNHAALPAIKKNRVITLNPENLIFGTDLQGEQDKFEMWYSQDDRNVKSLTTFKVGTQIAHPTEVVSYQNS